MCFAVLYAVLYAVLFAAPDNKKYPKNKWPLDLSKGHLFLQKDKPPRLRGSGWLRLASNATLLDNMAISIKL